MPNKDPEKRREAMRKYRGNLSAERKREINAKGSEYHRQRDKTMGKPHKRVYTKNGGVWNCAMCGATHEDGVQLDIHHKDQNRYNNNFNNLVCLCKQCHDGLHMKWRREVIPRVITELIRNGDIDWTGDTPNE